ncbi:S1C family serine protease [Methylobacterium nigriterrae]|uniref:S1C family serine protease n=1 Tax=Methylobacterium nigriterrae TaxID=3127512 RepID=UPI003013967D
MRMSLRALLGAAGLALYCVMPLRVASAAPVLSIDRSLGKVSGWSLGMSKSLNGCVAAATYQDETTVWMGFEGDKDEAFLAFTNPRWRSIEINRAYQLVMLTGRGRWKGQFFGVERTAEKGLFASGLKKSFVLDLARAGGLNILFERKSIARLSLSGSSDALSAMVDCQKSVVEARASPEAPHDTPSGSDKKKDRVSLGTGFFVSDQGHVLTNNHVIKDCTEIAVAKVGMPSMPARLVVADATNDLAVLATDHKDPVVPALGLRPRVGENIYVYGFPLGSMLAASGNFTVGNVTAVAGQNDDSRHLQISAPIQPGNSGGPLMDQYGSVVGVIVSRIGDLYVAQQTDMLPQNINFAIKSSVALGFLDANGIPPAVGTKSSGPMDAATVAEQARLFTLRVVCYRH